MKTLLAALLVCPTLAIAQVPLRPPGPAPQPAPQPQPPPQRPTVQPTTPVPPGAPAPTTPAPAAPGGARPTAPQRPVTQPGEGTIRPTEQKCVPLQGRFMLSFNKADIVDVLEQASRWTCRNFVYTDDVARGKITLLSKTPVTADEAYAAFLAALNANNIAVYSTGRYYKLIRNADAKKNPIPTYTDPEAGTPANEQPITKVVKLQYTDADQLRGILGNFISPQGADIQSIPPDTLVITDIGLNLRRIEKIIESVDKPGAGDMVRIIQVRYAAAKDIADKLNQIFQAGGAGRGRRAMISAPGAAPAPAARPGPVVTPTPGAGGPTEVSVSKILADDRTNKLIVIADEKSFQRILELVEQLDVPTTSEGGIHVVFLRNATAEDLAQTLSNLAQGVAKKAGAPTAAPGGVRPPTVPGAAAPAPAPGAAPGEVTAALFAGEVKITADKTQNALLIQASAADFNAIRRIIETLDRPRRQVFVEAVLMEVNLRDQTHIGVGAHGAFTYKYKGQNGVLPIASEPGSVSSLNLQSAVSLGGFLTGFVGPVSAELKDLGLNLPSIGILIQALQSNSDVNVLSTPHIVATDNEDSEIAVGQNVPFQAGFAPQGISNLLSGTPTGATPGTSTAIGSALGLGGLSSLYAPIQRQNVELRLKIKPQISEGGNVRLTIEEQTEEIVSTDPQLGPTTAKRSVKTQIVAKDQSTIVLGGMYQERNLKSVSKIPFLGSLPVIGWLFRDTTTTKQKTNLLLFLTPYIIRDEADYRRIYEKKRKEQQEFMEQFYGRRAGFEVDVDFSRKAGPYSRLHRGVEEESSKIENGGRGRPGEGMTVPPTGRPDEAPAPGTPPTPPPAPGTPPLSPQRPAPQVDEGTPVDRLEVQPEVPAPGSPPPAPGTSAPAGEPPPPPNPPAQPPGQVQPPG